MEYIVHFSYIRRYRGKIDLNTKYEFGPLALFSKQPEYLIPFTCHATEHLEHTCTLLFTARFAFSYFGGMYNLQFKQQICGLKLN